MRITRRVGIALVLLGFGLLFCPIRWLAPQPQVALDMPVSLSPGHVTTGNFSVTANTLYYIDIELDKRSPIGAHCEPHSVLNTQWVLSSDAGAEKGSSPWEDSGLTITGLVSENTRYKFDVEILPGASCLNANNPRLRVQTRPAPSDLYAALGWLSILLAGMGFVLLILPHINRTFSKIEGTRMFPDMVLRNCVPLTKHTPLPPIHGLPHLGLFFSTVFGPLIFVCMLYGMYGPREYKGLHVSWPNREAVVWEKSPWQETLAVYVRSNGHFFVNGEEVERRNLYTKLLEHLNHRMAWSVYFEADYDSLYMDDIYAIDTIQSCGAKVIWVTPKMREELQHNPQK
jgi:biopolymer transport protein ExbD